MTATTTDPKALQLDTCSHEQDERRVRACISACAGLTTEALEGGIIHKMLTSLASANDALDVIAARAAQNIPDGFIPMTERLPLIGEDHQQVIEKRGETITVLAWRYPPAPAVTGAEPDTVAGRVERAQVAP
ncbi:MULTISPECIES: hypothetical protein [Burkholderia cepacia complex]|uniref:hypothetical protein n=1 Tax=Burkholderia cepacia complex TaxID=87882 RepID=UPI001AA0447A|nr:MULTISPECIES: hypothetical protein [Burkholderia cepacia complex]QTD88719.1 hypothetical protein J4G50_12910 [Burkholderia anthina]